MKIITYNNITNGGFKCRTIFCKPSIIDGVRTNLSSFTQKVALIGGSEWVEEMQRLAAIEGYTKPDNIGWDYEYIDYLIYGVETPE